MRAEGQVTAAGGGRGDVIISSTVGATAKFKDAWGMGAGGEGDRTMGRRSGQG